MFSYVDKNIRNILETSDKLVYLNRDARLVSKDTEEMPVVSLLGPVPMPILIQGKEILFHWYSFVRRVELRQVQKSANAVEGGGEEAFRTLIQEHMSVNSVLATPNFRDCEIPYVRLHSCCMTGDVFGSMRCECGPQLQAAFERIAAEGGAIVYMSSHEGRGIGLWAKAITYMLQDQGQDTYQANVSLGLPEDSRDFSDAAVVLRYLLNERPIRLLSNNPLKYRHLENNGQKIAEVIQHVAGVGKYNLRYLRAKRDHGHCLPEL